MTDFRPRGFQQIPLVVRNLLIINVLVFLTQLLFESRGLSFGVSPSGNPVTFDDVFALHSWQSNKFRWWQMFTHMFMHGGFGHIFFNMFALWMFGRVLEGVWGPQRFIIFYLVCGLGAALCHLGVLSLENVRLYNMVMAYQDHPSLPSFVDFLARHHLRINNTSFLPAWQSDPNSVMLINKSKDLVYSAYMEIVGNPTVGASGAVFGLLFAFGYLFPNTEFMVYLIPVPVKAKWLVAVYALVELSQGLAHSAGDNIAHFAHLGGMLFAFILLRIWKSRVRNDFY